MIEQSGRAGPRRAARRRGDPDVKRIARALRFGAGHVAVMAADVEQAEALVDAAIEEVGPARVMRVAANTEKVLSLVRDLMAMVAANPAGGAVVVVISDADLASVKQLERLRVQLESGAEPIEKLRMVLVGGRVLQRILDLPAARAFSSRIGLKILLEPRRSRLPWRRA